MPSGTVSVYAIASSRAVPDVPRLRAVRAGGLTALVADVRRAPAPTPAALRRYHATIAALAEQTTALLPARFGTVMTEAELAAVLLARAASLRAALAHVRGASQMTIRLLAAAGAMPVARDRVRVATSGAAYLRSRAAESKDAPGFEPVRAAVRRWVKEERVERKGDVISVYHLVPRRSVAAYTQAAGQALGAAKVRAVISGPFPAYAFTSF